MQPTSPSSEQHRQQAPHSLTVAVVTVSDSRTLETDEGGKLIADLLVQQQHQVHSRHLVSDDVASIQQLLQRLLSDSQCQTILVTGGTGMGGRDRTPEAIEALYDATLPGYGELFRALSFQEIGAAAMLSRASAGRVGKTMIFTMPGSPHGVRLAMVKLILPELAHLVHHASSNSDSRELR